MDLSSCGTPEARRDREVFFRGVFGAGEGIICIGVSPVPLPGTKRKLYRRYFNYPGELNSALDLIETNITVADLYFCPQLLNEQNLHKGAVVSCPNAWADLDDCTPIKLLVPPSIAWETSPGRFQAIWRLDPNLDPLEAEALSRRIAYYHAGDGADRSGWDLTQFLRVPRTGNFKHVDDLSGNPAIVRIVTGTTIKYRLADFEKYPDVKRVEFLELPLPSVIPTEDPLEIIQRYRRTISPLVFSLFETEPQGTWSEKLWRLMILCFEAGMEMPEVLHIANQSACNKYRRDGRPIDYLWRDVCRAYVRVQQNAGAVIIPAAPQVELLTPDEQNSSPGETFIERYIRWASDLGDAAPQYHTAGAFIALSSILSGHVRLPTSFGTMVPNLWFMILADTTLTRKSTAMDIAMDLVNDIDDDVLLATDGSLEGMMQALSTRPGQPSVFLRDEFSGLLEMMTKRDYYAGMAEMLTKLYDGKIQKRILRKETVEVREPVLLIFAGGIRNRVQALLTTEHISSGFMPRFVFITAESDAARVRPLGPPMLADTSRRDGLLAELSSMVAHYHVIDGTRNTTKKTQAELSPAAWARYNKLESDMLVAGLDSERPDLMTPVFDRLSKSTLKAALLIAASRQRDERVCVTEEDIVDAIRFTVQWRTYAIEVINGVGKSAVERDLDRVLGSIVRGPGVSRSQLMRSYHLTARQADAIFDTLIQRGLIAMSRLGGTTTFMPLAPAKDDRKVGK